MVSERQQRNERAQKEDHIRDLVAAEGKVKVKDLYGMYTRKYQGTSIRTFLNEYLTALEFRREIIMLNDATGYWAFSVETYQQEVKNGKIKEEMVGR